MTAVDGLGYLAAALVLATFCAKRMVPLRALAIASNIAFVTYGFFAGLWPILLLHAVMLPMNAMRLREALGSQNRAVLGPRPSLRPTSAAGKQHPSRMGHAARFEPV
jgi:CRP/FNR family cyclic AMP-dependent transcriptional regulator